MDETDSTMPDGLANSAPRRKATVSWSAAVDRRLDQLVALAKATQPDRSDLLAAIVAATPPNGRTLDRLVAQWRGQTVRNVVLGVPDDAEAVEFPRHRRGRRPRSKA